MKEDSLLTKLKNTAKSKLSRAKELPLDYRDLIRKWQREGPESFIRDAYYVRSKGEILDVTPWKWQKEVLDRIETDGKGRVQHPIIFLSLPSRTGKSLLSRWLVAYELICAEDAHLYFVSTSREQIRAIQLTELAQDIGCSPVLSELIPEKYRQRDEIRNPYNGSVCRILPQRVGAIQGLRADMLSISELWKLGHQGPEILTSAYMRLVDSKGCLLIDSLMPAKESPLNVVMELQEEPDAIFEIRQGEEAFLSNPNISKADLKRAKKLSLAKHFKQQVLNMGVSQDKERAWGDDVIDRCLKAYSVPATRKDLKRITEEIGPLSIYIGVDRSGGKRDNTAVVTLAKFQLGNQAEPQHAVLNVKTFPESSGSKIRKHIKAEHKRLGQKIDGAYLETYQCLDLSRSLEKEPYIREVELIHAGSQQQTQQFSLLKMLMADGRLWISKRFRTLITELQNFGYSGAQFKGLLKDRSGEGRVSDDAVYALGLAIYGSREEDIASTSVSEASKGFTNQLGGQGRWSRGLGRDFRSKWR